MVDTVDHLEVLGETVGLKILGDDPDALEALVVVLDVVGAVLLEALLLKVKLDVNGILSHGSLC